MSQERYDNLLERYTEGDFPSTLGEPGHFLITSLLSVWKERDFPDEFRIGNHDLSLKCGILPSNIGKTRKRVLKEVIINGHHLLSYKSQGHSRPGLYRVNPALLKPKEVMNEPEEVKQPERVYDPAIKNARQLKKKRWNSIPYLGYPTLKDAGALSQTQVEQLDRFGIRHLRPIKTHYYIPSTQDTELLYDLFRTYTPRQIVDKVIVASKQGIDNALVWIREGANSG